jgi:hypothetical protein
MSQAPAHQFEWWDYIFILHALRGYEDLPFRGTVRSMGWGIFVTDGSSAQSTALLPSVSPTIDWVEH